MLGIIFKTFRWLVSHAALFIIILIMLLIVQGVFGVYDRWKDVVHYPKHNDPLIIYEEAVKGNEGPLLEKTELEIRGKKEDKLAHHAVLLEEYNKLYFYQVLAKIDYEVKIRNTLLEVEVYNKAIDYLIEYQIFRDREEIQTRCDNFTLQYNRKQTFCNAYQANSPFECKTLRKHLPPWRTICKDVDETQDLCDQELAHLKRLKDNFCSRSEESTTRPEKPNYENIYPDFDKDSVSVVIKALHEVPSHVYAQIVHALLILIAIIASPYLINLITYFGFAKIASSTLIVRLNTIETMSVSCSFEPKDVLEVVVNADNELIVHPDYIRTADEGFSTTTKSVFSYRYIFTSLASGLQMLTCFKTDQVNSKVFLSCSNEVENKLSVIKLSESTELVLSPRQIVGVLQQKGAPLVIKSKWIFSPAAWLAGNLRLLIFSGQVSIILKGSKGIIIKELQEGTSYVGEGVVGYTSNLQVQPVRTETFWAFHTNKRPLFKHRFSGANGYVLEEVFPKRDAINFSGWSLRRLSDAVLRVLGI